MSTQSHFKPDSIFLRQWKSWDELWSVAKEHLGHRTASWKIVFEHLGGIKSPHIVETGGWRNFGEDLQVAFNDGASTWLFDRYLDIHGSGSGVAVELAEHIVNAINGECRVMTGEQGDSRERLAKMRGHADLLYLDSFDVIWEEDTLAAEHHLQELLAARHLVDSETLIVVDDTPKNAEGKLIGKGRLVAEFMQAIGNPVIYDQGYQVIYRGF